MTSRRAATRPRGPLRPNISEETEEVLPSDVEILPAVEDVEVVEPENPGDAGEDLLLRGGDVDQAQHRDDAEARLPGEDAAEDEEDFTDPVQAPRRVLPDPGQPTARQREEHRIEHWPYRSWCRFCVEGRCTADHHRGMPDEHKMPTLCFDYLFCTKSKRMALKKELLAGEEVDLKILVAKEVVSKAVFAHAVDVKGADEEGYAVTRLVDDIRWLGSSRLALKSDNEKAIVKVLTDTMKTARVELPDLDQITEEHGARYDSSSNGVAENAVKQVQRMLRTLKLCLESRIGRRIPTNHAIMTWMVEHAAWILRNRVIGPDGKSAHQRVRGREGGRRGVGFAEKVLYMVPVKGPEHDKRAKLDALCKDGIVLGYCADSPEYHIFDVAEDKMIKARTVRRVPESAAGTPRPCRRSPAALSASSTPRRPGAYRSRASNPLRRRRRSRVGR